MIPTLLRTLAWTNPSQQALDGSETQAELKFTGVTGRAPSRTAARDLTTAIFNPYKHILLLPFFVQTQPPRHRVVKDQPQGPTAMDDYNLELVSDSPRASSYSWPLGSGGKHPPGDLQVSQAPQLIPMDGQGTLTLAVLWCIPDRFQLLYSTTHFHF